MLDAKMAIQLLENKRQTEEQNNMSLPNALAQGINTGYQKFTAQKDAEKQNVLALWSKALENHDIYKNVTGPDGSITQEIATPKEQALAYKYIAKNGEFPEGAFSLKPKDNPAMIDGAEMNRLSGSDKFTVGKKYPNTILSGLASVTKANTAADVKENGAYFYKEGPNGLEFYGPDKKMVDALPAGVRPMPFPTNIQRQEQSDNKSEISMGLKDADRWGKLVDKVNVINASSRKAIGVAASSNMRADRLLATVNNPNATSQDISNIVADIQAVYKGGVPDQVSMAHGDYRTFNRKLSETLTFITNKPQSARSPEVLKKLKDIALELKAVDNKVIKDNLDINAIGFEDLIKKDPDKWNRLRSAVMQTTENHGEPQLSDTDKQAIQWAQSNPNDKRAISILKAHGMR